MLYAKKGIDYYKEHEGDAYQVDVPDFLQTQTQTRVYAKLLFLMAINAKTDKKAFAAFRENRKDKGDLEGSKLKDVQLQVILNGLRTKHPQISDGLGSDAGIELRAKRETG